MEKNKTTKKKITTFGKVWRCVLCILVPLGGGVLISLLTRNAMEKFGMLEQPPLAPPAWLFPVAWTILYVLMGVASYLIYAAMMRGGKGNRRADNYKIGVAALVIYGAQLLFNFMWTPIFFNAGLYWVAFSVLAVMWALEIALLVLAFKVSRAAFWCLLPYLCWTTFAAYLNISIAILN